MSLLSIQSLNVHFQTHQGLLPVVENFSLELAEHSTLGIVGESGSGKSVTMMALMDLLPDNAQISAQSLLFDGIDLTQLSSKQRQKINGCAMSMIFQEPSQCLDPCFTVEQQLCEAITSHEKITRKLQKQRALDLLIDVGIPDPKHRLHAYPHQLSGGMAQRIMIAMAIATRPKLLIADEPTTALDVTIQGQILDLLLQLKKEHDMTMIFITHDMGVIHEMADNILVMYCGEQMEYASKDQLFNAPQHPYTQALLTALPEHNAPGEQLPTIPGQVPQPAAKPTGCVFSPRCAYVKEQPCTIQRPDYFTQHHTPTRCFFPLHGEDTK